MKINYNLWARYIPTLLVIIPVMVYINLVVDMDLVLLPISNTIKYIGLNIPLGGMMLFFFALILRILSKSLIEDKLFKRQELFPTTQFLYGVGKISPEFKNNIIAKIKSDFNINLSNSSSIQTVIDAVGLVRKRVGNGHLVLRRNIEYGFMRNLIVGTPLVVLFCVLIILEKREMGFIVSFGIYGVSALALLIFCKAILNYLAEQYAKQLFSEYLEGGK